MGFGLCQGFILVLISVEASCYLKVQNVCMLQSRRVMQWLLQSLQALLFKEEVKHLIFSCWEATQLIVGGNFEEVVILSEFASIKRRLSSCL